jgi:predicted sugar kinase
MIGTSEVGTLSAYGPTVYPVIGFSSSKIIVKELSRSLERKKVSGTAPDTFSAFLT